MCRISVFMTCYNASPYIEECIDSVLSQSFQKFEFIIVDDGSTDDTVNKIKKIASKKISLFQNNHNYIESLNLSVKKSKGKYLAKMDADDIMMKDRLLIQYNYLEHHEDIDLLAGGMEFFGNGQGLYIPTVRDTTISIKNLIEHNMIAHPTVMIRRESLQKLPYIYEPEYIYTEDYKLWFTMLEHDLRLDNIPDILIKYRISNSQISLIKKSQQKEMVKKIKSFYSQIPN